MTKNMVLGDTANSKERGQSRKTDTDIHDDNVKKIMVSIRQWLSNPTDVMMHGTRSNMRYQISPASGLSPEHAGDTTLFQQFYVDKDISRHHENQRCLFLNTHNKNIDRIILLNEKLYSDEELGVVSDKIRQVVVGSRITYKTVFKWVRDNNIEGFVVLANADIFFDSSLKNLKFTNMHAEKKLYSLLRYEYNGRTDLKDCKLFGPRPDSQDSWIWHTNWRLDDRQLRIMDVQLGMPGCDNKMVYIFNILGFACYNEPELIRSYHYHTSQIRNYDATTTKVLEPYYAIYPVLRGQPPAHPTQTFDIVRENDALRAYVAESLKADTPFIIPRIAGIENEVAVFGALVAQTGQIDKSYLERIKHSLPIMKKNAGIQLSSLESITKYGELYLSAFHKCQRYCWWEPWGNVATWIPGSFAFITSNFEKPKIDALALDVFHSINREPWTLALKGKRLLIISPFEDSFREKLGNRAEIYGIDLFPDCEFIFIKPPQTQGDMPSREFDVELNDFIARIDLIKDQFDVALCSCGGYGNLVCSALHGMGKSAIYVGGVLQMYFGVYGTRWLRERGDVMRLYINNKWSRPKEHEKPKGYKGVEASCYW